MKTYLSIDLARNDGGPDNSPLHVAVALNKYGFILQDAYVQDRVQLCDRPQASGLSAQVLPPSEFRRMLPRLAAELACEIVLTRFPDEPPRPRSWHVTSEGIYPFDRNA